MDWIGAILESIRELECPCCGAPMASCGVRGIRAEPGALVVRLGCRLCGENSIAVVKRDRPETADPITRDEVLDAHELLEGWRGPVAEIFTPRVV